LWTAGFDEGRAFSRADRLPHWMIFCPCGTLLPAA
jgi:hypothetical protein